MCHWSLYLTETAKNEHVITTHREARYDCIVIV